jgi:hypothetical protein
MARFGLGIAAAAVVLALTANIAMAGEVTGSGQNTDQNQGRSWCSFSGLNDDPTAPLDGSGPNGPGVSRSRSGRMSSWVSPSCMVSSVLAWPAIRTGQHFLPNRTGPTDALIGPDDLVGADP